MLYGLWIQRDVFTKTCLFFRVDSTFLHIWWQLRESGNLEHALGGWWNLPILEVDNQEAFIQEKVLNLIWSLRESPKAYRSRF